MIANEVDQWTALSDPTRRAIVERLTTGPKAVGELAQKLPVSRPAVSQHLNVLKRAGLVVERSVGTRHIYRLDPDGLSVLRAEVERFWTQALASYKRLVEQETGEDQ